jgi:anti-anti-sigma factor
MSERQCHIHGDFDVATVPHYRALLRRAINVSDADVLVDCTQMTFIDSTGITALLEAHRLLTERGRHLLVANVKPRLRRPFEILGVEDLLEYDRAVPAPRRLHPQSTARANPAIA